MRRFIVLLFVLIVAAPSFAGDAAIGKVVALRGEAFLVNPESGARRVLANEDDVFADYKIVTGKKARVQLILNDDSIFTIGRNSEVLLDEFVYDPVGGDGKSVIENTRGILKFVTGKIAKKDPSKVKVNTPFATIGVRGSGGIVEVNSAGQTLVGLTQCCLDVGPRNAPEVPPVPLDNVGTFSEVLTPNGGASAPKPVTPEIKQRLEGGLSTVLPANLADEPSGDGQQGKAGGEAKKSDGETPAPKKEEGASGNGEGENGGKGEKVALFGEKGEDGAVKGENGGGDDGDGKNGEGQKPGSAQLGGQKLEAQNGGAQESGQKNGNVAGGNVKVGAVGDSKGNVPLFGGRGGVKNSAPVLFGNKDAGAVGGLFSDGTGGALLTGGDVGGDAPDVGSFEENVVVPVPVVPVVEVNEVTSGGFVDWAFWAADFDDRNDISNGKLAIKTIEAALPARYENEGLGNRTTTTQYDALKASLMDDADDMLNARKAAGEVLNTTSLDRVRAHYDGVAVGAIRSGDGDLRKAAGDLHSTLDFGTREVTVDINNFGGDAASGEGYRFHGSSGENGLTVQNTFEADMVSEFSSSSIKEGSAVGAFFGEEAEKVGVNFLFETKDGTEGAGAGVGVRNGVETILKDTTNVVSGSSGD